MSLLLAGAIYVTSYICAPAQGQPYCGNTASGTPVHIGSAACPPDVPFGLRLRIEGVPWDVTCDDTYARQLGPRVDVFAEDLPTAFGMTGWRAVQIVNPSDN